MLNRDLGRCCPTWQVGGSTQVVAGAGERHTHADEHRTWLGEPAAPQEEKRKKQ